MPHIIIVTQTHTKEQSKFPGKYLPDITEFTKECLTTVANNEEFRILYSHLKVKLRLLSGNVFYYSIQNILNVHHPKKSRN